MKKPFRKSSSKSEKGQVLVVVALTIIVLVGIIGLAVDSGYMYLRYSYLNRAVDAAALAGSGEFKNYNNDDLRDSYIRAAAWQLVSLNKITPDATPGTFTDPVTAMPGFAVETCHRNNGDAAVVAKLCAINPLEKIVRVSVQERVPMFFLAVLGIRNVPITISAYSTAASLDAVLVLDTSASMADDSLGFGSPPDPESCNLSSQCEPLATVQTAAKAFSDQLYYPYDHLAVVGYDQTATLYTPLIDDNSTVKAWIDTLKVYEGAHSPLVDSVTAVKTDPGPTKCIYFQNYANAYYDNNGNNVYDAGIDDDVSNPNAYRPDYPFWDWNRLSLDDKPPSPPAYFGDNTLRYFDDQAQGPCRLFNEDPGGFVGFDCPMFYGNGTGANAPDPSNSAPTNLHDAVLAAGNELTADARETSVWAVVVLSDGRATAAHWPTGSLTGTPGNNICPQSTWTNPGWTCRDTLPKIRHCLSALEYIAINDSAGYAACISAKYPADSFGTLLGTSSEDPTDYDADDAARDAFDLVASNNTLVFTIGLGPKIPYPAVKDAVEPGETLLNYGASVGHGEYLSAQSSSDLTSIFLQIAKLIDSRINQ